MSGASYWHGLGSLKRSGPPKTVPLSDDNDEDCDRPIQRTVPANGAPSPFSHPYIPSGRSAGSADTSTDESAAATEETPAMGNKRASPAKPVSRNLQLRIGAIIHQAGRITRAELAEQLPELDSKQVTQTLFNMGVARRAKKVDGDDGPVWTLTPFGVKWIEAGKGRTTTHKPKAEQAPARKAKPARRPEAPRTPDQPITIAAPLQLVQERSFRCAVFSDGAFHLAKNGQAIDLTAAEFAEALRYVERMAEQPGA